MVHHYGTIECAFASRVFLGLCPAWFPWFICAFSSRLRCIAFAFVLRLLCGHFALGLRSFCDNFVLVGRFESRSTQVYGTTASSATEQAALRPVDRKVVPLNIIAAKYEDLLPLPGTDTLSDNNNTNSLRPCSARFSVWLFFPFFLGACALRWLDLFALRWLRVRCSSTNCLAFQSRSSISHPIYYF